MAQIILFQSLNSSGATSFALNTALGIKHLWPEKKVALFSEGKYIDILSFCGKYVEKEKGCYIFCDIEIFSSFVQESVRRESVRKYDYILVDLDRSAQDLMAQFWQEQADVSLRILSLLPSVFKSFPELNARGPFRTYNLLNKSRGVTNDKAKELFLKEGITLHRVFPFQSIAFWKQDFLGIPVLQQKNSRWGRALFDFITQEILHA